VRYPQPLPLGLEEGGREQTLLLGPRARMLEARRSSAVALRHFALRGCETASVYVHDGFTFVPSFSLNPPVSAEDCSYLYDPTFVGERESESGTMMPLEARPEPTAVG
jgi:hypothetical protein